MIMQCTEGVNEFGFAVGFNGEKKIEYKKYLISMHEDCELISAINLDDKFLFIYQDKVTKKLHKDFLFINGEEK